MACGVRNCGSGQPVVMYVDTQHIKVGVDGENPAKMKKYGKNAPGSQECNGDLVPNGADIQQGAANFAGPWQGNKVRR